MTPRKITDNLSVSAQILPADIAHIKSLGFKSIIANRPDGEGVEQPPFSDIEQEAEANGLVARYIPVRPSGVSDADTTAFAEALADLPKPVLAFCRSGTRCTVLWALSEAGRMATADILATAGAAGYDLSGLAERIDAASPAVVEGKD